VRTASASIGVAAHNQTGGDTILPFTPVYTSDNTTDFPIDSLGDYLTYTVTATGVTQVGNNPFSHIWTEGKDGFNGEVPYLADFNGTVATFTQTFYEKDGINLKPTNKERIQTAMACGGIFSYFGDSYSPDLSIPGVTEIMLSEKVTEGDIPQ
jgi:hypothetical protein